jgi:16S rRNA (adenine1518-N6/adenine1519-N6)-dimethyltransferase
MQTKQQIQQLLASAGVEPNKRLGQNFLIDLNLMRLLVDNANIGNDDIVLEVGCGTGSLTQALAERAGKVIAVEMDETLAKIATRELANAGNVKVINADILEIRLNRFENLFGSAPVAIPDLHGEAASMARLGQELQSQLLVVGVSAP